MFRLSFLFVSYLGRVGISNEAALKNVFSNAAAEIWFSTICTHFQVKEKGFKSHRHGNAAQPVLTVNNLNLINVNKYSIAHYISNSLKC